MKLILSSISGFPVTLLESHDIEILNEGYNDAKEYLVNPSIKDSLIKKYTNLPKAHWKIWHTITSLINTPVFYKDPRQSEEAIEQFKDTKIQEAFKEATGQIYHGDGFYLSAIPREWDKEPW